MFIAMAATILVAQELGNHAPQKPKSWLTRAIILGLIAAKCIGVGDFGYLVQKSLH